MAIPSWYVKYIIRTGNPQWDARFAGEEALSVKTSKGYLHGSLNGQSVLAHRVIFKMFHGLEPIEVDHINGNKTDNRPSNLQASDQSRNQKNAFKQRNNSSGANGVYRRNGGRWRARAVVDGLSVNIGTFDSFEAAKAARLAFDKSSGFSERHGSQPAYPRN